MSVYLFKVSIWTCYRARFFVPASVDDNACTIYSYDWDLLCLYRFKHLLTVLSWFRKRLLFLSHLSDPVQLLTSLALFDTLICAPIFGNLAKDLDRTVDSLLALFLLLFKQLFR